MDRRDHGIGRGGDDGEGADRVSLRVFPNVIESGKPHQRPVLAVDEERLAPVRSFAPFIEAVRRDYAALRPQGFTEGRLLGNRLRPRVDERVADARVLRPKWNQAPAHEYSLVRALPGDDGDHRAGSDVVAFFDGNVVFNIESRREFCFSAWGKNEPSAHRAL